MIQIIKSVKQVLNRLTERFQMLKKENLKRFNSEDTVEAQAHTFRIWMWSSAAGLSLIVIASVVAMGGISAAGDGAASPRPTSMMDSLPEGYVIAPIEPVNIDSLDSIFEDHGYVDLYQTATHSSDGTSAKKGRRIARGLPLVRAPKNPRRFAVLVADRDSDLLTQLNEPVVVILRKKPPKGDDRKGEIVLDGKHKSKSPLYRERNLKIDLIEESIPEIAPETSTGAKS